MTMLHLADLVGVEVDFEPTSGETRHGTIAKATYSTSLGPVLVIHPACRPCELLADTVLVGPPAAQILSLFDDVDEADEADEADLTDKRPHEKSRPLVGARSER
jgi:hypothetical protein